MNMIVSKITNLLTSKKPKRYSVKKNRKAAISCLEKALQYALKNEVSILYDRKKDAYCLRLDKKFSCYIPITLKNETTKSLIELLYEIADVAKTWGGAA
jgi:hypothetical protein